MSISEMNALVQGYKEFLKAERKKLSAEVIAKFEAEIKMWQRAIQVATFLKTHQNYLYPLQSDQNGKRFIGFENIPNGIDRLIIKNIHKLKITLNPIV